jgi:hypothetical protein
MIRMNRPVLVSAAVGAGLGAITTVLAWIGALAFCSVAYVVGPTSPPLVRLAGGIVPPAVYIWVWVLLSR